MAYYSNISGTTSNQFRIGVNGPNITRTAGDLSVDGLSSLSLISTTGTTELRFKEAIANGANYFALKAPATLASNITMTLPSNTGSYGQKLITNGSNTMSWADQSVYEVYASTAQSINLTYKTILYDTERFVNADYSVNSATGEITVAYAGTYKITYGVFAKTTNTTRKQALANLQLNGVDVAASSSRAYLRTTSVGEGVASKTNILQLSANDVLRVRVKSTKNGGGTTVANESNFVIERM